MSGRRPVPQVGSDMRKLVLKAEKGKIARAGAGGGFMSVGIPALPRSRAVGREFNDG